MKYIPKHLMMVVAAGAIPAWPAHAQVAPESVSDLPEVRVTAPMLFDPRKDQRANDAWLGALREDTRRLQSRRATSPDTTGLLQGEPGVQVQGAGGVSGLPVIRGLADERLRLQVDDMDLLAACANHMNPALSYIDPSRVERVRVYAGITPVSVGGDSIGGTIQVDSALPEFADAGKPMLKGGALGGAYRSNGQGFDASASAYIATTQFHLRYEGTHARADNHRAGHDFKPVSEGREQGRLIPGDEVASTAFRSQNHKLGAAWRQGLHLFQADLGWQDIPFQAFPNQRMDMTENRSTIVNLRHTGQFRWGDVRLRAWHQRIRHRMDMGEDRYTYGTGMPMQTSATTTGATAQLNWLLDDGETVRLGVEALRYTLHDWWPPVGGSGAMAPDIFLNIDYGRRNRISLFAEWERRWSPRWTTLMGVRHARVDSDAAPVQGYNSLPSWADDAFAFNARDRKRRDHHWDLSLMASHEPAKGWRHEFGVARKTRSPSLYQRYPWSTNTMAAGMNNYLGDGNGYLGNIDLEPEVAYTLSAGINWEDVGEARLWRGALTVHVTEIEDFIDAERCPPERCRSGNPNARNEFVLLRYVNQKARLYGVDLSGERQLAEHPSWGRFSMEGSLSWLRGTNRTTGDDAYNIMPANARLSLVHRLGLADGNWSARIAWEGVQGKTRVSDVRNEIHTAGYGLVHLRVRQEWDRFSVDVGVENLLDKGHALPLGGAYIGQGSSMMLNTVPWGIAVPGKGRSFYAGFNYRF